MDSEDVTARAMGRREIVGPCDADLERVSEALAGRPDALLAEVHWTGPFAQLRAESFEASLRKVSLSDRLQALTRLVLQLAYGLDPPLAIRIGDALIARSARGFDQLPFRSVVERDLTWVILVRSIAYAHFLSGEFDRCMAIVDRELDSERYRGLTEHYAPAYLLKAHALARRLEIAEARAVYDALTSDEIAAVEDVAMVVAQLIDEYTVDTFKPAVSFDYRRAIQQIVAGPMPAQRRQVADWSALLARTPMGREQRSWVDTQIAGLQANLERLDAISQRPDLTEPERYEQLMRIILGFQQAARALLRDAVDPTALDLDAVNARINEAATIGSFVRPAPDEIARGVTVAREAETWCRTHRDYHGLMLAIRAQDVLHRKAQQIELAHQTSVRLYDELRALRTRTALLTVRASFAGSYRRLIFDLCADGLHVPAFAADAFSACEFRRGLSIVEPRRPPAWGAPDPRDGPLTANLLGPRTHFLGLTAFDPDDPIFATCYCADGSIAVTMLTITSAEIGRVVSALDPTRWRTAGHWFRASGSADPRPTLARLLDPIRDALAAGRIAADDHICVAADDPIHAVPLQYLALDDMPAVSHLSFSRVASFADARLIVESPLVRPSRAVAVFVPAFRELDLSRKADDFRRQCAALEEGSLTVTRLEGREATTGTVAEAMQNHDVIHLQTHGYFPPPSAEADPIRQAGLLMEADGAPPVRTTPPHSLLTPADVLDGLTVSPGAHVSLSACVSGLGRRGLAGDTLGLELAFRIRGAASVVASHWDVRAAGAASFFSSFYLRWLQQRQSRAKAWRGAILDQGGRDAEGTPAVLEACAFSLFGDWR